MSVAAPSSFKAEVLEARNETPRVKTLRLSVPADFSFTPGMWIMIAFSDAPQTWRAYSISTSPSERGYVEISMNHVGAFTERLFELSPGATLLAKGPHGQWRWRETDARTVMISGGTGVTPFRSMGRWAVERGRAASTALLCSARSASDFLYPTDLAGFRKAGMLVYLTVTGDDAGWDGPRGRIDAVVVEREVPDSRRAAFYLCGPKSLIVSLKEGLLDRGVPQGQIHYEKWGDYNI